MILWSPPRRPARPAWPQAPHGRRLATGAPLLVGQRVHGAPPVRARRAPLVVHPHRRPVRRAAASGGDTAAPRPRAAVGAITTISSPAVLVAVLTQAPAGPVRGVALALGWAGLASWFDRHWRRRR